MFEDDLNLNLATGLSFVDHHPRFCNIDPSGCRYLGIRDRAAGAEFLATVVSRHVTPKLPSVLHTYSDGSQGVVGRVSIALNELMRTCSKLAVAGPGVTAKEPQASAIARALLVAMYRLPTEERDSLASLFSCGKCLVEAVCNVVVSCFDDAEADAVRGELEEWFE